MDVVESIPEQTKKRSLTDILIFLDSCDRGEQTPEDAKKAFSDLISKTDNVMDWLKHLESIESRQTEDLKEMTEARKVTRNKIARFKDRIKHALEFCGQDRIKGRSYYFGLSKVKIKKKLEFVGNAENDEKLMTQLLDTPMVNKETTTRLVWNSDALKGFLENAPDPDQITWVTYKETQSRSLLKGVITE